MNTDNTENTENENPEFPTDRRPFGFWLKVVDRRLSAEMEALFADDGLTRRDWRTLNLLAGDAVDERLAGRLGRKPWLAERLVERGWIDAEGETPTLTEAGREARERLLGQVQALRARVAGAVSPEEFATTVATLEKIARELGWDESQPLPRGRRGGRRFEQGHPHRGHGRFGHGRFEHERFGHGDEHEHGREHGFGRRDPRERFAREFGRGFAPGFERGARPEFGPGRGFGQGFGPGFGRQAGPDVHVHVHVHGGRRHGRPGRPEPRD